MSRFVVLDATVASAFEQLRAHAFPAAKARAERERREDARKQAKAEGFLAAEGTVAEREARSILTDAYETASAAYYAAIEIDEQYRNLRENALAVIESWRTVQANKRAMEKAG